MIVMSDQQFEANGIKRTSRDRRLKEQDAKAQRANAPVVQRQVDQNKPAFKQKRPNYSSDRKSSGGGGGAVNPLTLLMFLPLLVAWVRRRTELKKA
jgi:hypothetical protein